MKCRKNASTQNKFFFVTTQKIIVFHVGILSKSILYMPDDGF